MNIYDRDGKIIPEGYENSEFKWNSESKWGMQQRVGRTEVGDFVVSTVWLMGIDHGWGDGHVPIIFETMIFGDPYGNEVIRYCTEEEAMRGHIAAIDNLRAGKPPFEESL